MASVRPPTGHLAYSEECVEQLYQFGMLGQDFVIKLTLPLDYNVLTRSSLAIVFIYFG